MLILLIHASQCCLLLGLPISAGVLLHSPAEVVEALLVDLHSGGRDAVLAFIESFTSSITILCFSLNIFKSTVCLYTVN